MNTRVILNSVLVFVIVAALAGCIKVEFVNPNETGKSEFEVQAPTVAPTELPPTDEALPTATSKPTVTPKPEAVYVRIIEVLSEKFDNPDSDFGQNPNNWANEFYDAARLSNDNGAARFELYGDDWDLFRIRTTKLWKISEANIFESKLKLDSNSNNGQCRAHVLMQISVPLSPGKNWYTTCGLLEEDKFPAAECLVAYEEDNTNHRMAYGTEWIPINLGEWHTFRIEVNPLTYELKYYLDDELIGSYLPTDADELLTKRLFVYSQLHGCGDVVGHVDDILLARYP